MACLYVLQTQICLHRGCVSGRNLKITFLEISDCISFIPLTKQSISNLQINTYLWLDILMVNIYLAMIYEIKYRDCCLIQTKLLIKT